MLFSVQFLDSANDRWSGDSRCECDEGDGPASKVDGFHGRPKSPLAFVQRASQHHFLAMVSSTRASTKEILPF